MTVLPQGHCFRLRKAVGDRVNQLTTIKEAQPALFRAIYSAIKENFGVESYKDLKQGDFLQVLKFVEKWG